VYNTPIAAPSQARCAADLAWLVQSAPLLSLTPQRFSAPVQAFNPVDTAAISVWLAQLNQAHLHDYVAQALPSKAPMRLGRYAERLMEYFLRESGLFELLAANLPLRAGAAADKAHTTIGEFDYLIKDARGAAWHWELAVKFYLCHAQGNSAQAHDFKGPAGKDTLGLKLGKVFDKQLQHRAPAPYDTVTWQASAYARGWMFYPFASEATPCDALNPQHLRGWWLSAAQFTSSRFESDYFVHLPRLHWLAPYQFDELPVMNQSQAADYLTQHWRSSELKQAGAGVMLACVAQQNDRWVELSRGFVMPT
jgi:uncharacterized protein